MVCASALSFLDGKICAMQEPSITIIIIVIKDIQTTKCLHKWKSAGMLQQVYEKQIRNGWRHEKSGDTFHQYWVAINFQQVSVNFLTDREDQRQIASNELLQMWWLFPRLPGFGENVWPFIPHLCFSYFSSSSFFFFKVEISLHTLFPLFRPGSVHSGSVSWDDCGQVFPDKLHVGSFLDRFPHLAWTTA